MSRANWGVLLVVLNGIAVAQQASRPAELPSDGNMVMAGIAEKSTVQVVVPGISQGSGVWVGREGYIATCWHVVSSVSQPWQVVIHTGKIFHSDFKSGEIYSGSNFTAATVVAHDELADVAILKVEDSYVKAPSGNRGVAEAPAHQFDVPIARAEFPKLGEQVLLAGYPLQGLYLLFQFGNVAGLGLIKDDLPQIAEKEVRLFLSVTSNPGNSGGPVFDESGALIGLLEGNLGSYMRDEKLRPVLYYRPKRDESGNLIPDASGNAQPELSPSDKPLYQNSGISYVVPVHYLLKMLDEARKHPPAIQTCKPKPVLQQEVASLSPGLQEFLDSRKTPMPTPVTQQMSDDEKERLFWEFSSRVKLYETERTKLYQKQLALRILALRNDFAACGIHGKRLDIAYPDPVVPIPLLLEELPTLLDELP